MFLLIMIKIPMKREINPNETITSKEGKYDQWVKDAEASTKKKLEERRKRGLAEEQLQE